MKLSLDTDSSSMRKINALKLASDCRQYLAGNKALLELNERIEALKLQDKSLSNHEAIEILLDYAERELKACEEPKV